MFYTCKITLGDYTNYRVTDTFFLTSGDVCWIAVSLISMPGTGSPLLSSQIVKK